jgi:hypothetical protein
MTDCRRNRVRFSPYSHGGHRDKLQVDHSCRPLLSIAAVRLEVILARQTDGA